MACCFLFIHWDPSETIIQIGGFAIRWYGLFWAIGLLLGATLMNRLYKAENIKEEETQRLFIYVLFGTLIGARLGHCIFYEFNYYFSSVTHFVEMILPIRFYNDNTWKYIGYQGLASHGGVIGLIIALVLYHRKSNIPMLVVLDNMGICACITATFIRLGNLMNSEIIGRPTDVPWAFVFEKVDSIPRHPGQLYEAISYFIFFFIIYYIYVKNKEIVGSGKFFGLCLSLVFILRFFIEFTKEIQVPFEINMPLDMGQILSIPFIFIGLYFVFIRQPSKYDH